MLLMSDDLTDRIVLSHDDEERPTSDASTSDVTFHLSGANITAPLKKLTLTADEITLSFTSVPAFPIMLHQQTVAVKCVIAAGHYMLDFNLKNYTVSWDNTEGKQLCTIVNRLEHHARSSE
jgi:hypothetical protein